ncbi:DUF2309 domain-containing protein [Robertkochia marina]|uniref:Probable inorganic carbon transporter subunit DabA n=1 Tax=Robertkochia marina TaxID=1227945 RepID=A0A4S3M366_9FLAO|nr:DUF2309 domain-containing protein [Robertkochia marina]THD69165.1 DUF2309 domain-containing protein [Robertkochia marina]TRZ47577.1 DUF2309 domain-containing protein [Robertkochia marina]
MSNQNIHTLIQEASELVGTTWPLYNFVTSNPLSGYENQHFLKAGEKAKQLLGARVFPEAEQFAQAFQQGDIDPKVLDELLKEQGYNEPAVNYLEALKQDEPTAAENPSHELDRLTAKWVGAFMDEGLGEWGMPNKEEGFYTSWKKIAKYDTELSKGRHCTMPASAGEAIEEVLKPYSTSDRKEIITLHLTALPGWTGYIKHRSENPGEWQQQYHIDLVEYLAVRLWIAKMINTPLLPETKKRATNEEVIALQYIFLNAWERSWQQRTLKSFRESRKNSAQPEPGTPDAQMVFCIDTRSEPIRRHVEAVGNYETFGYAGFFGIAMDYVNPTDGHSRKSCPPIVPSAYQVQERPKEDKAVNYQQYIEKTALKTFFRYFLKRMKNMLPSTFGFVEGSGLVYGFRLLARTCLPGSFYRRTRKEQSQYEQICSPEIGHIHNREEDAMQLNISLKEKTQIVKSAFDLMGWKTFAPLVVFTGHGSHTSNNPFGSSLDCGACAASPGRHNARMLANLANLKEVRAKLLDEHGLVIPESTWFLGAEHNTTTDEIELFDSNIPETHSEALRQLKHDLAVAQHNAATARLKVENNGVAIAQAKAGSWAETRPEWGLAKNAGFIIAPRKSTKNLDLDGRCFLHSYEWQHDEEGKALEGIMQGPMVVTQWINNHYYFSSVDTEEFGSGSKITHNVTGMFGVVQGNGGDLKKGLPLQSLKSTDNESYHQPLRLSVIIEAPCDRVNDILKRNPQLQNLLDNQWIHLIVNDPKKDYKTFRYIGDLKWQPRLEVPVINRQLTEPMMAE